MHHCPLQPSIKEITLLWLIYVEFSVIVIVVEIAYYELTSGMHTK